MLRLLAQSKDVFSRFDGVKNYKDHAPFDYRLLVILLGTIVIVTLTLWLVRRVRRKEPDAPPLSVFDKAAAELGLTIMDRWLMVRIAKQQKLRTPLTLLASSQTLAQHANDFIRAQPRWRRASVAQRVNRIAEKLFAAVPTT